MNKKYRLNKKTHCTSRAANQDPDRKKAALVKIAIDEHARTYTSSRQIEGSNAQGPRRFTPEGFLAYAKKETEHADKVVTCYEAGPTGFHLHRKLTLLGITNHVVCP